MYINIGLYWQIVDSQWVRITQLKGISVPRERETMSVLFDSPNGIRRINFSVYKVTYSYNNVREESEVQIQVYANDASDYEYLVARQRSL